MNKAKFIEDVRIPSGQIGHHANAHSDCHSVEINGPCAEISSILRGVSPASSMARMISRSYTSLCSLLNGISTRQADIDPGTVFKVRILSEPDCLVSGAYLRATAVEVLFYLRRETIR